MSRTRRSRPTHRVDTQKIGPYDCLVPIAGVMNPALEDRLDRAHLLSEVARRANVSVTDAEAVVGALDELFREGNIDCQALPFQPTGEAAVSRRGASDPCDEAVVQSLIEQARAHPLGIEYLEKGLLGSVAATFQVHAFTVLVARQRLNF